MSSIELASLLHSAVPTSTTRQSPGVTYRRLHVTQYVFIDVQLGKYVLTDRGYVATDALLPGDGLSLPLASLQVSDSTFVMRRVFLNVHSIEPVALGQNLINAALLTLYDAPPVNDPLSECDADQRYPIHAQQLLATVSTTWVPPIDNEPHEVFG